MYTFGAKVRLSEQKTKFYLSFFERSVFTLTPSHFTFKPLCTGRLTTGGRNGYPSHYPHILSHIHSHRTLV